MMSMIYCRVIKRSRIVLPSGGRTSDNLLCGLYSYIQTAQYHESFRSQRFVMKPREKMITIMTSLGLLQRSRPKVRSLRIVHPHLSILHCLFLVQDLLRRLIKSRILITKITMPLGTTKIKGGTVFNTFIPVTLRSR